MARTVINKSLKRESIDIRSNASAVLTPVEPIIIMKCSSTVAAQSYYVWDSEHKYNLPELVFWIY